MPTAYLRKHWNVLRHAPIRDPALGVLALLEKVARGIAMTRTFPRHHQSVALVPASAEKLFALMDDHARLSAHMTKRSWKMGGGRMAVEVEGG